MKPIPIALQLYTVREEAARDPVGTLRKVAEIGYPAVELAGLYGMTPAEFRALTDELGLAVCSNHGSLPTEDNREEILEMARTMGYKYHVSGFGPDQFATLEGTLEAAAMFQRGAQLLEGTGVQFAVHNHWWEFDKQFDGKYPHEHFMEAAPEVLAQIDTYWTMVGGADPATMLHKYGARVPLLHIKDGPGNREDKMTAVGSGKMDWPAVFAAASPETAWAIVELDACETDMLEAVAESYRYLTENGFCVGKK